MTDNITKRISLRIPKPIFEKVVNMKNKLGFKTITDTIIFIIASHDLLTNNIYIPEKYINDIIYDVINNLKNENKK